MISPQVMQLVLLGLLQLPFAIAAYFLAKRMRSNALLWALTTMIPMIGFYVATAFVWRALFVAFKRIEAIETTKAF